MAKILSREAALMLIAGLLCAYPVPKLLGLPADLTLFWVGTLLGLTFAPIYALSVLVGNKAPVKVRTWLGVSAWAALFVESLPAPALAFAHIGPWLFGLILALLAGAKVSTGERYRAALGALFAYSFPLVAVRWLLVPMVGDSVALSGIALQTGVLFMLMHGLVRIFWPGPAEGVTDSALLVKHAVPENVVALVERTARRRALPYAMAEGNVRDRTAISVACTPGEVGALVVQLQAALGDMPFVVAPGPAASGQVQISIRPCS